MPSSVFATASLGAESGHSSQDQRGQCAWTRTFPVDAETRCMVAQPIPAPESQRRNLLGNQDGYVLQESFAPFHGSVHNKSAD